MNRNMHSCLVVCTVALVLISAIPSDAQEYDGNISLYVDTLMSSTELYTAPWYLFYFYVIIEPGSNGLFAAEYRLNLPPHVIGLSWEQNPAISLSEELGNIFNPGITISYTDCQNDMFWAQRVRCTTDSGNSPYIIEVVPHLDTGFMGAATCIEPDHPLEDYYAATNLVVNLGASDDAPALSSAEATSPTSIYVEFTQNVSIPSEPSALYYNKRFFIYDTANPQDTIRVSKVWQEQYGDPFMTLTLESVMVPGTDYRVVAKGICHEWYGCRDSDLTFHYDGGFDDKPDLWAIDMTTETLSPSDCTPFQVGYSVYNMGALPAGPFSVRNMLRMYDPEGNSVVETILIKDYPGLDSGCSITDSLQVTSHDNYDLWTWVDIHVDYYEEVDEWSEYNNYNTLYLDNFSPKIMSLEDQPGDFGGSLVMTFKHSFFELFNAGIDIRYDIFRRLDDSDLWDIVAQVPGSRDDIYQCNVPTVADSGDGGQINWSVYRVALIAPDGVPPEETETFLSCPDSGYSLDNSIATLLQAHAAWLDAAGILIRWKLSSDSFSGTFTIDRSEDKAGFLRIDDPAVEFSDGEFRFLDNSIIPGMSYCYRIGCIESGVSTILFETRGIEVPKAALALYQNSPNPFNPSTTISWFLPGAMHVRLEIFDVSGRSIHLLRDEEMEPGQHSIVWKGTGENGSDVSSGIYFLRLSAGK
jgi:hypothetical protein